MINCLPLRVQAFNDLMALNWAEVTEGVVAGIVASVLLGAFALSRDSVRNAVLDWKIRQQFRFLSYGFMADHVTIGVRNHTGRAFVVRDTALVTKANRFTLNPLDVVESSFENLKLKKIVQSLKKTQDPVFLGSTFQFRKWKAEPTAEGFTAVQPFTERTFALAPELLTKVDTPVYSFEFLVEYTSWTNQVKLIQVESSSPAEQLTKTIESFQAQRGVLRPGNQAQA